MARGPGDKWYSSSPPVVELTRSGGRLLTVGTAEAKIDGALLTVKAGRRSTRQKASGVPFTAVAADGKHAHTLAAGDAAGRVALFDVLRNRYSVWRVPLGGEAIAHLCFVSHGKELVVSAADGSVVVLSVADGSLTARLVETRLNGGTLGGYAGGSSAGIPGGAGGGDEGAVVPPRIVASEEGDVVATFSPLRVVLWNAADSWQQLQVLGNGKDGGSAGVVAVRLAGGLCLVLFDSDRILAWEVADGFSLRFQLSAADDDRTGAGLTCFAAAPSLVVAGGRNAMVYFWDSASEVLLRVVEMPSSASAVVQLEFLHKSAQVAVLGDDGRLLLWSSTTCE